MTSTQRPSVFVAVPVAPALRAMLEERCIVTTHTEPGSITPEALMHGISTAEGVLANPLIPFPPHVIQAAPHLRAIANIGVGYDNVDIRDARARGIAVANTPGVLSDAVADCAMGMMISVAREFTRCTNIVRDGSWGRPGTVLPLGTDLKGKTLGLVGFGRIGREVAARALAFKMRVLFFDPYAQPDLDRFQRTDSLEALLSQADFVSLHVNLNETTRSFFGAAQFAAMKPGAFFINAARGGVVDQVALCAALADGSLHGAALDVLMTEPPLPDDPILACDNVFILPHIASGTVETRQAMAELAVCNLIACLYDEPCDCVVNA